MAVVWVKFIVQLPRLLADGRRTVVHFVSVYVTSQRCSLVQMVGTPAVPADLNERSVGSHEAIVLQPRTVDANQNVGAVYKLDLLFD